MISETKKNSKEPKLDNLKRICDGFCFMRKIEYENLVFRKHFENADLLKLNVKSTFYYGIHEIAISD